MAFLKKLSKNVWFVPFCIVFFSALLIWFIGPYIGVAEYYPFAEVSNRLLFVGVVLLICLLVKFYQYNKKSKLQNQMMQALTDNDATDDVINAESKALKDKFDHAFSLLKNTKGGPDSLVDIPWYMMIGAPGSGKTTLLSNSGLEFPLFEHFSNQAVQGIGGTKDCDWWITKEAVLLDTAGRYTSRDSHQKADESGWNNFLSLIKKYRKKPISGLLVSFSMSDLVTMNEFELGQQLIQIKQRIAELNDFFNTRFPVYVVITKTDMLAGFSQFYENFSHHEREQTFGITFDAESSSAGDLVAAFNHEFKALIQSLTRRQWHRMSSERDAARKALIYGFSDQLSSVQKNLVNIIAKLTEKDEALSSGIIRGLYFTSGTQHGAPIDKLIHRISHTFGLKNNSQVQWNNDQRSYFIKDLLQQVVFPESEQFGVLASYEKRKQLFRRISIGAATFATVLMIGGWFVSYGNNVEHIAANQASIESWKQRYSDNAENSDIRYYLPALNDFSANLSSITQQQGAFSGLGLAQSTAMQEAFEASYNRLLKTALMPFIKQHIEHAIVEAQTVQDKYQALKAYLMLANSDKRDDQFLNQWLEASYKTKTDFSSAEVVYVAGHSEYLIAKKVAIDDLNEQIIADARTNLLLQSLANIYYQEFKQLYLNNPDMQIAMSELAGAEWRTMLSTERDDMHVMSRLFTPEQFKLVLTVEIAKYITLLERESWLLGENNNINSAVLSKQLINHYTQDYINSWKQLLNGTRIKNIDNALSAEGAIKLASAANSPLVTLINNVAVATQLSSETLNKALKLAGQASQKTNNIDFDARRNDAPNIVITAAFEPIHEFVQKERLAAFLKQLSTITTPLSLSIASTRMSQTPEIDVKLLKSMGSLAYQQPEPMNVWLTDLAQSAKRFNDEAHKTQIAALWQESILPQCESITAYKYPFSATAATDTSLRELAKLFSANGEIVKFYQQNLKPLVDESTSPWRWHPNKAKYYQFSPAVLAFFEKVAEIQDDLFSTTATVPNMKLSLKPISLDSRVAKFKMAVNDKRLSYQFGRPTTTLFNWPADNREVGSSYTFVRQDGSEVVATKAGLFSFFKLLDAAKIDVVNNSKVNVTFEKEGFTAKYQLTGLDRINPIAVINLSRFKCLATM